MVINFFMMVFGGDYATSLFNNEKSFSEQALSLVLRKPEIKKELEEMKMDSGATNFFLFDYFYSQYKNTKNLQDLKKAAYFLLVSCEEYSNDDAVFAVNEYLSVNLNSEELYKEWSNPDNKNTRQRDGALGALMIALQSKFDEEKESEIFSKTLKEVDGDSSDEKTNSNPPSPEEMSVSD